MIGILGLGSHLPPAVRKNDWWPESVVEGWARRPRVKPPSATTPAMARVVAAMADQSADPFLGAVERRVLDADRSALDMEADAAAAALADAGVSAREVDVLLVHTAVPDVLLSNGACALHARLGLPVDCLTLQVDASGHSFMMQLTVAEHLIAARRGRFALLVQSALGSRLLDPEDPGSVLFGDGAAACVVGPTARGGLVASLHRTDGRFPRALVASVPGARWYDEGRVVLHQADPEGAAQVFLETADQAKEVADAVLARSRWAPAEVDVFAMHQGTPWLRRVVQETLGATRARTVDSFSRTAYLFGASIPIVLERARREELLAPGDRVLLCGGGVGAVYGAQTLIWS